MTAAALHAALARAVAASSSVGKDGANSFHRYKYASAEAIYAEARAALAAHGLALVVCSTRIDGVARPLPESRSKGERPSDADRCAVLVVEALLTHAEGGSMPMAWEWPIVVEAGRPADKAVAGARTSSLAYAARDLLMLPRVDESDEMDGDHRDRARDAAEARAAQARAADAQAIAAARKRVAELLAVVEPGSDAATQRGMVEAACGGRLPVTPTDWQATVAALESLAELTRSATRT